MTDLDKIKVAREELEKLSGLRAWRSLVVDDDPIDGNQLCKLLKTHCNCETELASSCMEALARTSVSAFDYVFMDVMMPKINGIECFDMMRLKQPDAKVIFASGMDENFAGLRKALDNGALRLIKKPYDVEQVKTFFPSAK